MVRCVWAADTGRARDKLRDHWRGPQFPSLRCLRASPRSPAIYFLVPGCPWERKGEIHLRKRSGNEPHSHSEARAVLRDSISHAASATTCELYSPAHRTNCYLRRIPARMSPFGPSLCFVSERDVRSSGSVGSPSPMVLLAWAGEAKAD